MIKLGFAVALAVLACSCCLPTTVAQGKCDKCNVSPCQGGCKCDQNCDCIAGWNVCSKCNYPQTEGGCKCDNQCACRAGTCLTGPAPPPSPSPTPAPGRTCRGSRLPAAPAFSTWPSNRCDGTTARGTCVATCNQGRVGSPTTTCLASGSWTPVSGSCTMPPPAPSPPPGPQTGFVRWDANAQQFTLGGRRFVPVGFNAYWLGLMEAQVPPSKSQIEEMFVLAARMNATVIRSHSLGVNFGSPNSLRPGTGSNPNRLNPAAWDAIDYSFFMAARYGIKLIVPLLDAYEYSHGGYSSFCRSRNIPKDDFFTNQQVRADFKDYISQWLARVSPYTGLQRRNDPALFLIELGNELGNIRSDQSSYVLPTREWNADISAYIKTLDSNHMVLSGCDECLGSPTSDDFNVPTLDVFSAHFYGEGGGDWNRLLNGANRAASIRKPYFVGEYSWKFSPGWYTRIEATPNVKGTLFWSVYPHERGLEGGAAVPHNDGFTLHWPEDAGTLNSLANHFRRMRGLPTDGGSAPPPGPCDKCNIPVEQGGCKCNNVCACI